MVVAPARQLAERARPRVGGEHRESVLERLARQRPDAGAQRRAAGLEPQQPVAGILPLQLCDHAQGIVDIAPRGCR